MLLQLPLYARLVALVSEDAAGLLQLAVRPLEAERPLHTDILPQAARASGGELSPMAASLQLGLLHELRRLRPLARDLLRVAEGFGERQAAVEEAPAVAHLARGLF